MWMTSDYLLTEILGPLELYTYSGRTSKDGYTYYHIRNKKDEILFEIREDEFDTLNNKLIFYYRKHKIDKIKEKICLKWVIMLK